MAEVFEIRHETGDLSEYDSTQIDGGDLSVTAAAALAGSSFGLQCLIDDANTIWGKMSSLTLTSYRFRFYFDPNSLTMADGDIFNIFRSRATTADRESVRLRTSGGNLQLSATTKNDASTTLATSHVTITDAPHYVEVSLTKASSAVASDGTLEFYIDGTLEDTITGIDRFDLSDPDNIEFGVVFGVDVGTSGTIYLDELVLRDDNTEIGPFVPAAAVSTGSRRRRRKARNLLRL